VNDTILSLLLSALDIVVFEREPNASFRQITPSPAWLEKSAGPASLGEGRGLAQAFPFLEHFLGEAELAWRSERYEPLRSETFAMSVDGREILLRATAISALGQSLLVLEQLHGPLDPREVLQGARDGALVRERQARILESLGVPAEMLGRAVVQLAEGGELAPAQRPIVDTLRDVSRRLDAALRGEVPAGRAPRSR
jgi:hypothetical protein